MLALLPSANLALDWGAVGVIGGAVFALYQIITSQAIKTAISELRLTIQDRFATVEKEVALNYERHLTLAGVVRDQAADIAQLQKDIAYRDGRNHSQTNEG